MSGNKPRIRMFTELDAALDTRFGLLRKYFPQALEQMGFKQYSSRLIDEFPGVSYADFKKVYDARGDDALEFAVVTNIHSVISTTLHGAFVDSIDLPITSKPELVINLWPYTFDAEEQKVLLKNFQLNYIAFSEVTLANTPLDKLTPSYVKNNFDYLVLYNANEWLGHHNHSFETVKIPAKRMVAPALFHGRIPSDEDLVKNGQTINPFDLTKKAMAPMLGLDFADVETFSCFTPEFNQRILKKHLSAVMPSSQGPCKEDDFDMFFKNPAA